MPNARFWIRWNGTYVKLTLEPGQDLDLARGESTEEGWLRECAAYSHEGDHVRCDESYTERDCDGLYTRDGLYACDLEELRPLPEILQDPPMPIWQELRGSQRDYSAQAAGY